MRAGRATFLLKVKSHRGEPINQQPDTLAEEGREISDDNKSWDDWTDRMTCKVRRKGTRRLAQCGRIAYATLSESKRDGLSCKRYGQQRRGTGQRRCGATKTNAGCGHRRKEQRQRGQEVPGQRRRRVLQVVTGTFPCGQQLQKYGYRRTAARFSPRIGRS